MTPTDRSPRDIRHRVFLSVSVAFLIFLYLFSPFTSVFLGWFVEFEDNISHKVHEVTFGLLFSFIFVGVVAQLRESTRSFAGLIQAAAAALSLSLIVTLTTGWEWPSLMYLVPLGAVVWLHPDRSSFTSVRPRPDAAAVVMMLLITAPLLEAFTKEFGKAANEVRQHQAHWAGMAAFALTLLIIGYLAALRVDGWPLLTWSTGISLAVYGVLSLFYRFDASARPGATAVLAIVWSFVFVSLSKLTAPVTEGGTKPRRTRLQRTGLAGAGLFVVVIGMFAGAFARGAPPVPHTLESYTSRSCLACHATGDQHAPVIDWPTHNIFEAPPRAAPPFCGQCHDLPELVRAAASQEVGVGSLTPESANPAVGFEIDEGTRRSVIAVVEAVSSPGGFE